MDHEIQPPVFVVIEGHDVEVYTSLQAAVGGLEGVDVAEGVYKLFDSIGRRIALRVRGVHRGRFIVDVGTVEVESVETAPTGASELRTILKEYLRRSSVDTPITELVALVEAVRQVQRLDR